MNIGISTRIPIRQRSGLGTLAATWTGRIAACGLLVLLALLSACDKPKPAAKAPVEPPWHGKMTLSVVPSPPVSNKEATFQVHVMDESGKAVSSASVKAALVMTTMDMGKNEVTLADQGNGDYLGKGKFTMAGPWTVNVVAVANGSRGQQTFPVVVHRE